MTDNVSFEERQAFRDFEAYLDGAQLPVGVHVLSTESQEILASAKARADATASRFVKRVR
jgi:hypothetical protein